MSNAKLYYTNCQGCKDKQEEIDTLRRSPECEYPDLFPAAQWGDCEECSAPCEDYTYCKSPLNCTNRISICPKCYRNRDNKVEGPLLCPDCTSHTSCVSCGAETSETSLCDSKDCNNTVIQCEDCGWDEFEYCSSCLDKDVEQCDKEFEELNKPKKSTLERIEEI